LAVGRHRRQLGDHRGAALLVRVQDRRLDVSGRDDRGGADEAGGDQQGEALHAALGRAPDRPAGEGDEDRTTSHGC
jgi:hypothetical protein